MGPVGLSIGTACGVEFLACVCRANRGLARGVGRPLFTNGRPVGHEKKAECPDSRQRVRHTSNVRDDLWGVYERGFRSAVRLQVVGFAQEGEQTGERLLVGFACSQSDAVDLDACGQALPSRLFQPDSPCNFGRS